MKTTLFTVLSASLFFSSSVFAQALDVTDILDKEVTGEYEQKMFEYPSINKVSFLAITSLENHKGQAEEKKIKRATQFCKAYGYEDSNLALTEWRTDDYPYGTYSHPVVTFDKLGRLYNLNDKQEYRKKGLFTERTKSYTGIFSAINCYRKVNKVSTNDSDRASGKDTDSSKNKNSVSTQASQQ